MQLRPAMSTGDAFLAVAEPLAARVMAAARLVRENGGGEALHRLRVDLTRLRTALSLFSGTMPQRQRLHLETELKWLRQRLAAARDWEVLREQFTHGTPKSVTPDKLAVLSAATTVESSRATRRVRQLLGQTRCGKLMSSLEAQCSRVPAKPRRRAGTPEADTAAGCLQPIRETAAEALAELHAAVHKRGRHFRTLEAPQLHRLRTRLKRLRYASELLQALYQRQSVRDYIAKIADLQARLGAIQDAAVTRALASKLEHRLGPRAQGAAALLRKRPKKTVKHKRRHLRRVWRVFKKTPPFWMAPVRYNGT